MTVNPPMTHSDRVATLDQGAVSEELKCLEGAGQSGRERRVAHRQVHKSFVGSPALNLIDGPLRPAPAGLFFAGPSKRQAKLPISSRYSVNYALSAEGRQRAVCSCGT